MSARSVVRRSWQSFTGGRAPSLSPAVARGRVGYALWQRVLASFVGLQLRPRPGTLTDARSLATEEPSGNRALARRLTAGRFVLPSLPALGALAAAGGDSVVLEASLPDGRAGFLVRRHGGEAAYSLELVVRGTGDVDRPLLSTVTYRQPDGDERVLLVPVVRGQFGLAAAYVRLPGFGPGTTWAATAPEPVSSDSGWDLAAVGSSIDAALNEATRDAWRRVREFVNDEVRDVIDDSLR